MWILDDRDTITRKDTVSKRRKWKLRRLMTTMTTLVLDERGERGAKRGRRGLRRRRRRRIGTCSGGRAAPCAACCQRARRRRAAASRHPLTPDRARTYLGGEQSRWSGGDCHVVHTELARSPRSSHTRLAPVLGEGYRGPPSASSVRGAPDEFPQATTTTTTRSFPLLPPWRRGESRRRQHTVDTKTQGPRGHTVGTRRESPRTMTMIMI